MPEWSQRHTETLYNLTKYISIDEDEIKTILNLAKKQKSFIPITVKSNIDRQTVSRIAVNVLIFLE